MELRGKEKELWEKIKPFLVEYKLKEDAPAEIIEAFERLKEIASRQGQ